MKKIALISAVGLVILLPHQAKAQSSKWSDNFNPTCYEQSRSESFNVLNEQKAKADESLEEEWGEHDANDPALRPQLEKHSELRRAIQQIKVDIASGNGYLAQGELYKVLELLKDPLISERAFSKSVLNLSFLLDDIGVDPGLSATQVDRLLTKAIENEERVRAGAQVEGVASMDRTLQYAVRKAAYLHGDWERLLKIITDLEKGGLSLQRKVDVAVGYIWVHDLSGDQTHMDAAYRILEEIVDSASSDRCLAFVVGQAATHMTHVLTTRLHSGREIDEHLIERSLDYAYIARSSFGGIDVPSYHGYAFDVSAKLMQSVVPYVAPQGAVTILKKRAERYAQLARTLR